MEPLTPEMRDEVIAELKRLYNSIREDVFRREAKFSWMTECGTVRKLSTTSTIQPSSPQLVALCNKPTLLYWARSAQQGDDCPLLPFGCIYKEWFRCHDDEPNIEFGHFFASPIRITPTGPATIAGILEAHKSICDQASSLLGKIERGEIDHPYMNRWPNPRNYTLLPLCRAIIVILDELWSPEDRKPDEPIILDEVSQKLSVVMVRTGDESGLSAPICFENIRAESLPLARSDITPSDNVDAVRVSIATAVAFIADLQRREETAFPDSRDRSVIDISLCPGDMNDGYRALSAEAWANTVMRKAKEKGIDNVWAAEEAVHQVQAAKRGEVVPELTPYYFNSGWR